jgi:hypothetical protein
MKEAIAYLQRYKVRRAVEVFEVPERGNYYIIPWLRFCGSVLTMPVKMMKMSETSDELLFTTAVEWMKYCRRPTMEEIEDYLLVNDPTRGIFNQTEFKRVTGHGDGVLYKKTIPRATIDLKDTNNYSCSCFHRPTRSFKYFECNKDATIEELASTLRTALINSI